ncbi:MAG: hypothetical protein JXB62_11205 [Pirellulales bacterium]|nr:hypothetical protein [Pirellulales bacterium]
MFARKPRARQHSFRCGNLVEVRSRSEILATLDAEGRLDGLPLMPEMLQYCGRRLRVYRRVEKVYLDMRHYVAELPETVLLEDVRCDGSDYGGCQMGCLMLWKTAWLRPAAKTDEIERPDTREAPPVPTGLPTTDGAKFCCQAAELQGATRPLSCWVLRQYVEDYLGGDWSLGQLVRMGFRAICHKIRWRLGLPQFGKVCGSQGRTPDVSLSLQPGERVRIKSRKQIRATLDAQGRTRGLGFSPDMVRYCGGTYRVARRVERTVLEWSGAIREIRNTVALEGVTCSGIDQRCCPRNCYHLWREVWLERLPEDDASASEAKPTADHSR